MGMYTRFLFLSLSISLSLPLSLNPSRQCNGSHSRLSFYGVLFRGISSFPAESLSPSPLLVLSLFPPLSSALSCSIFCSVVRSLFSLQLSLPLLFGLLFYVVSTLHLSLDLSFCQSYSFLLSLMLPLSRSFSSSPMSPFSRILLPAFRLLFNLYYPSTIFIL